jgi:hypothetical protein
MVNEWTAKWSVHGSRYTINEENNKISIPGRASENILFHIDDYIILQNCLDKYYLFHKCLPKYGSFASNLSGYYCSLCHSHIPDNILFVVKMMNISGSTVY